MKENPDDGNQHEAKIRPALPDDVVELITKAKNTPLLTAFEEKELGRRMAKWESQDPGERAEAETAITRMVEAKLRLLITMAVKHHRSQNASAPLPDLIRAGHVGLVRAARRFDPALSDRFSPFAAMCIRARLMRTSHESQRRDEAL